MNPGTAAPDEAAAFLNGLGARGSLADELLSYNRSAFVFSPETLATRFPLDDEPFAAAWEALIAQAEVSGVYTALRTMLIQLAFPIAPGISATRAYLDATRRGVRPGAGAGNGLELVDPESLELRVHQTPAGRLPMIVAKNREDFESLVRAFTRRNEPVPVPPSQGACLVAGYNNWGRLGALRKRWEAGEFEAGSWEACFARLKPRQELYQDRFVILHDGPYSAVPAPELGLDDAEWRRLSLTIRREHEGAHYFTRRVLRSMRDLAWDEIIADFIGLRAAVGRFRADWFLRFMGLEGHAACRPSGRLYNYLGSPPLSPEAFALLAVLVRRAAANLDKFSHHLPDGREAAAPAVLMLTLAHLNLIETAFDDAPRRLACTFDAVAARAPKEMNSNEQQRTSMNSDGPQSCATL